MSMADGAKRSSIVFGVCSIGVMGVSFFLPNPNKAMFINDDPDYNKNNKSSSAHPYLIYVIQCPNR